MKTKHAIWTLMALSLCVNFNLLLPSLAGAAPAGTGETVLGKVGNAIGGTVKGVGNAISNTGEAILGVEDVAKAQAEIDERARTGLKRVTASSASARKLLGQSYGYAVFDSRKISIMLTTGSGSGVVVDSKTGKRTYMRMATAGAGLGFGAQFFQVIFLFENKASLDRFVNSGWEANGAATAVFGKDSLEMNARFVEGMAVYQLNEAGIMADLNLTGTRYWRSDELNG